VASFLETGAITPADEFYCNGYYEYTYPDGRTFRIGCLGTHGHVDAEHILKYSCNAGAAYASERISTDAFSQMLRLFGFGSATGIPLNGEERGMLRPIREWSPRSKPTIAIGQEISVTAMQVMKAATAFANEGVLLEPHIVKKIVSPDGKLVKEYGREPVRQILSPDTAKNILNYMESVTLEGGTATRASIAGIRVSAKTGTAQMVDPRTGKYSNTAFVASCLALFPTDDPEVIVYVVIESPQGDSYYGGRVAAPVVRKVGEFIAPYLGIPQAGQKEVQHPGRITLPRISLPEIGNTLPDFTGLPKRVLLPLLGREDMKVVIRGSGWVYRQSPPAGSPLTKGMTVVLELR
jgi:cell division protein FtsI (penicillin-binding protein 3)